MMMTQSYRRSLRNQPRNQRPRRPQQHREQRHHWSLLRHQLR